MQFWLVIAALVLLSAVAMLFSMLRTGRRGPSHFERNLQVYQRQLQEIDLDLEKGTLEPGEARQSRMEVSRRMLRLSREQSDVALQHNTSRPATITAAVIVLLALVPGSIAIYLAVGAPGYRDLPLKSRIEMSDEAYRNRPSQGRYLDMIANNAGDLANDVPGGSQIGADSKDDVDLLREQVRNLTANGDLAAAAQSQSRIIGLLGSNATWNDRLMLAELHIDAAGGYVSPEAEAELRMVLELAGANARAEYYLGLLAVQIGRPDQALQIWISILQDSGPDPAIRVMILEILPAVARLAGIDLEGPVADEPAPVFDAGS